MLFDTDPLQIGMITMDNASNNNTMLQEIADELRVMGILFDVDGLSTNLDPVWC